MPFSKSFSQSIASTFFFFLSETSCWLYPQVDRDPEEKREKETEEEDNNSAMGNSIIFRRGWSSSFEESMDDSGISNKEDNCDQEKLDSISSIL